MSREDTKEHVDTCGMATENTEKCTDTHGSSRQNRRGRMDTCGMAKEDIKKRVDTRQMSQRIWGMNSEGKKTSETPECHRTWTMSDSTNSGVENESLSGMVASVAICGMGRGKKNVGDTGMPPDADDIRINKQRNAENEFCRGWRQVLQYMGVGRGKKNVGDTGMPLDVDNIGLDN
jgi:hypothetical protein